ncbi:hypothetical protein GCM10027451_41830 [Geodermatophilus aquaeductus]|uniref:WD40-like Beta Propeller Repeat n=1 Tax=Geodermatophilus aquaeductus TaxID=1564161 RepID=A0A521BQY1_9ACTN|nr:hypothetical protein [Geodermatophilus aquaeductus]SMO49519.1 hypothetical protein SAMN06273567_101952 [Geodermatophilus aquaeductus]
MTSRRAAVLTTAAVLLLSACGTGWPDDAGGPVPPGPYAGLADRALFRDVVDGEFGAAHVTGDDAVVYVLGDRPFDVERDDLPRPPDVLLAHPVTADGLGEPVVFTEGEHWPRTTSPLTAGLAQAPDGDALLLAQVADDSGVDRGLPELVLLRFDPGSGEVTRVPLAWEWPFAGGALLTWTELACDAEGTCVARLSEGDGADADVVLDADTGEVLAEDPPGADLPGTPAPDGTARVLFGADTREAPPGDSPGYDWRLPWAQYATAAGEPAGPRVPLAEVSAVVVDSHLRPDGTLLVAVQEEHSNTTRLLALTPGDPAPTVLAETGGAPPRDALVVDEDAGQAHLLGAQDVLVPVLLTVDLATGEVAETGPLCPEDAAFDHLRLTAAGAVAVGSCEGRAEGLWVLR